MEYQEKITFRAQQDVDQQIVEDIPLISSETSIASLNVDCEGDDQVYSQKVQEISKIYRYIRKTRPDGNCFYRAFCYTILEHLIKNKDEFNKFRQVIEESKAKLIKLNFPQFSIEDFYDTFMEVLDKVEPVEGKDVKDLLFRLFNDKPRSDLIVIYLRLLTSAKLQEDAEYYSNLIEGSLLEFCKEEVEPMYKESNHIHISALCAALGSAVRVVYMNGEGSEVTVRDFPDSPDNNPYVFLLNRFNRYDILYQ